VSPFKASLTPRSLTATLDSRCTIAPGNDDQFEFEFALDLLLDGLERIKHRTP